MPIGRLAMHVARLPDFCTRILTTSLLDMDTAKFPNLEFTNVANLIAAHEHSAAEARAHLCAMSDEELGSHWKMTWKGQTVIDAPKMVLYRTMFLNHLVHHRGQLSVYLRLRDVAVPGLYGPSADEAFA